MQQIIENWSIVIFIIAALVALGGILSELRSIAHWRTGVNDLLNPKDINDRFITAAFCANCQTKCQNQTAEHFAEIKDILKKIDDRREENMHTLGEMACSISSMAGAMTEMQKKMR
jgi:hypothetical protein